MRRGQKLRRLFLSPNIGKNAERFQMYDHLDVDEFDIPVDAVIAAEEDAE